MMDLWFIEPVVVINEPWLYTERGGGRNQEPLDGWPETLISSLSLSISSLSLSLFIGHVFLYRWTLTIDEFSHLTSVVKCCSFDACVLYNGHCTVQAVMDDIVANFNTVHIVRCFFLNDHDINHVYKKMNM